MTDPTLDEYQEEIERLHKFLQADYLAEIKLHESIKATERQLEWLKVQQTREIYRKFREEVKAAVSK